MIKKKKEEIGRYDGKDKLKKKKKGSLRFCFQHIWHSYKDFNKNYILKELNLE